MKIVYSVAALAAALAVAQVHAQAPGGLVPVPASIGTATPTTLMLRAGTQIALRTITPLTTEGKTLKVGTRFDLETAEAVSVNGQVVIPAGSRAVGEVTDVRYKGMWGKSGRIGARLVYVQAGDRRIRLTGSMDDKGVTGTGGVVASVALIPIAGFFVTGTSAKIAAGSGATGFLEEDVPVQFAAALAPLVVAPVATPAVPTALPAAQVTPVSATVPATH